MITFRGAKVTPTEFAKLVIEDAVGLCEEYWDESFIHEYRKMSKRERDAVQKAMYHQANRVRKLIGWAALCDAVNERPDEF